MNCIQPYKIKYNTEEYDFRGLITNMLDSEYSKLEDLHKDVHYDLLDREHDQKTIWHTRYYRNFKYFQPEYFQLICKIIKVHFGFDKIIYQKIPTFRCHMVGNLGVGEYHKDKTYNHGISEINCWMPVTDAYDTNTIWIESEEDKGDYQPQTVKYGEILIFDGANLMHGNKINDTLNTRVSVDFRIVDPSKFTPNEQGSINTNTKFTVGGYFDLI